MLSKEVISETRKKFTRLALISKKRFASIKITFRFNFIYLQSLGKIVETNNRWASLVGKL